MRYFTFLLLLILAVSVTTAQTTLTIKAQAGKSWQNYGDDFPINGYDQNITHYGFSAELFRDINPHFALGIGPGYMRRGAACEPGFFNGDFIADPFLAVDATIFLDYVQIPFLVRGTLPLFGKLEVFGQGGAGFSYLVGGFRDITTFFVPPSTERRKLDFEGADQNLNRFDFGWSSTLGFAYPIGKGKLRVSGDHYNSFLDMNQRNTSLNRNWAVGLSYQFTLSSGE